MCSSMSASATVSNECHMTSQQNFKYNYIWYKIVGLFVKLSHIFFFFYMHPYTHAHAYIIVISHYINVYNSTVSATY